MESSINPEQEIDLDLSNMFPENPDNSGDTSGQRIKNSNKKKFLVVQLALINFQ